MTTHLPADGQVGSSTAPGARDAESKASGFQPEIQALRALAVTIVVGFHLWPTHLTGGFIGVDVFFAISGYLITAHLLREISHHGTVYFRLFWARRIRRLLPAAAVVLATSFLAMVLFLPHRLWQGTALQIAASSTGIENWALASNSVDYFAANNQPSLVQHFWSLSLEEQFYLFWPVFLGVLLFACRKSSGKVRACVLGAGMCAVFAVSLSWSVVSTISTPAAAYFSPLTHGWEFAAGGILALLTNVLRRSRWDSLPRTRAVASWIGVGAILYSAVSFTGQSAFPGWIALIPTAGTLLVIAAGTSSSRIQSPLLLKSRPVQFIGGSSYSAYLWHWPLIVAFPFIFDRELGLRSKVAVLLFSLLLGWLTKVLVEDPARISPLLNKHTWVNYAFVALTATAIVASSALVWNSAAEQAVAAQHRASVAIHVQLAEHASCFGAAAMEDEAQCPDSHRVSVKLGPDFAVDDWGSIAGVTKDGTLPDKSSCVDFSSNRSGYLDCSLGDQKSSVTMAVVGDSHALAMIEPLAKIAEEHGWKMRAFLRNSCTASLPMAYSARGKADCNSWREQVANRIADDSSINIVVTTGFTRGEPEVGFLGSKHDLVQDYSELWSKWKDHGKRVFVVEDVPLTSGQSVPECVASQIASIDPCAVSRASALAYDPVLDAVAATNSKSVSLVPISSAFCDRVHCHSVIGGVIAYRDPHHLSATFALTLFRRLDVAVSAK